MQVNNENIVIHGDVDPDKSYFDGLYVHTANPHAGLTARTAWINKRDAPNLTMAVRAYVDTIGDLLDDNTPVEDLPCLSINDKGVYFGEDRLYDIAKVYQEDIMDNKKFEDIKKIYIERDVPKTGLLDIIKKLFKKK